MRKLLKQKGINGNGAVGTVSWDGPIGLEVYRILMRNKSATPITDFTNLNFNINGEPVFVNLPGQLVDEVNQFDDFVPFAANGILEIVFECQKFIDGVPRLATSLNTGWPDPKTGKQINQYSLSWDQSSATDWEITLLCEPADRTAGPGAIQRWQKYSLDLIDGEKGTTLLPWGDPKHMLWRRVGVRTTAGTPRLYRIEAGSGSTEIFRCTPAMMSQLNTDGNKAPGTYFDTLIDFSQNGMPDWLNTMEEGTFIDPKTKERVANSLNFIIDNSAAATGDIWVNSIGEAP